MIHLLPTIGHKGFKSKEEILERAIEDLRTLERGEVDAIIIENNYDIPHKIKVSRETAILMAFITGELKKLTNLPIGINVLWNDYETALSLAKIYECDFVRIPVFVDDIKTDFGEIKCEPNKIIEFRKKIKAENIMLLADIHVKHSKLINERTIAESAQDAILKGADGLIVTGAWTGAPPSLNHLKEIKRIAKEIPVIVGSGADENNILQLFEFADAIIVSTSLKEGDKKSQSEERNIKPFTAKINPQKLRSFMEKVNKIRNISHLHQRSFFSAR